jgi:putative transposase
VVKVTGGSSRRVSLAALLCTKPGHRPRLIYRVHHARRHGAGQRKGVTETGYARLLDAAHRQLGGPLVVVWDNPDTHVSHAMTALTAARDWLTVYRLPPYAHELNPAGPVWSHLKRSLANLAKRNLTPAHHAAQDPAQADAIPPRPARRLPRQHRARPHTLLQLPHLRIFRSLPIT